MANSRIQVSSDTRSKPHGCTGLDNPDEPLKCVFSTTRQIKIGTGTTARKQTTKHLWYITQRDVDAYGVRKINTQFVPVGDEETIDQETLLAEYTPEVEVHNQRVEPAMQALKKTVAKGDKHRSKSEPLSAEMEYTKALDVDEHNVRAMFGLGLVYLERQDADKARTVFDQLVAIEAAFDCEHKHLFNEFGIALRKNELYQEAIQYYSRAIELTDDDENLYFNLSRAAYEQDDWESCFAHTLKALEINSQHEESLAMCKHIVTMAHNPTLRDTHTKSPVPPEITRQAEDIISLGDAGEMTEKLSPGEQNITEGNNE